MNALSRKTGVPPRRKGTRLLRFFCTAMTGLTLSAVPSAVWAANFSQAELFFELNNTDEDLGIHAAVDGGAYSKLVIKDARERVILRIAAHGRLVKQGLTQLFFESAEPSFDELDPAEFFLRFPEGEYEIEAKSLAGETLEGEVILSHVLAAPAGNITVNGMAAAANCDADPLPSASEPVLIDWDPVITSHPTVGKTGPVEIVRYQFFVEQGSHKLAIDLPPTVTQFQVPASITALGGQFKFEIIARTASGNNTAIESCYTVP